MDPGAFTLTGFAFPVAPATLPAFTLAGFQWLAQVMPGEVEATINVPSVTRSFSVGAVATSFDVPAVTRSFDVLPA